MFFQKISTLSEPCRAFQTGLVLLIVLMLLRTRNKESLEVQ